MSKQTATISYRQILAAPDYRVGSDGSIWNRHGKKMRGSPCNQSGHLQVMLYIAGKRVSRLIHRIVLETFVGPCPVGMESRHFPDRDPTNNAIGNLQWATRQTNFADKILHGTDSRGERCGNSKLTALQVMKIRRLSASGIPGSELSRQFGVTRQAISLIVRGDTWRT